MNRNIRNLLLTSAMSLLLTNCGGGGGGAVNTVNNFVDNVVSELEGSEGIVTGYKNTLGSFNSIISGGDLGSLQAVFTNPNSKDIQKAAQFLNIVKEAETLWSQTEALIDSKSNQQKYTIYNSQSYKDAYAAYLYLINHVKPVVTQLSNGQSITLTQFNKLADNTTVTNIINTEKSTNVDTHVAQKKADVNNIVSTEILEPVTANTATESATYVETSYVDSNVSTTVTDGTPVVATSNQDSITETNNNNGTITRTTTRVTTTTTTTPRTTTEVKTRTHTDRTYKDVTTTTTSTPRTKKTYVNGDVVITNGSITTSQNIVKTLVSTTTRSETVTVSSNTAEVTTTQQGDSVVVSTETVSTLYTNLDPNLGTRTPGYNSDNNSYKTSEFNANNANQYINADKAYARGWTGRGVTVAVADTGYATAHIDLQGQVIATMDYTGAGINDTQGHGTHVLGTIVAKKNDDGVHGVAFDSKAIVIKIGTGTSVNTSLGATGLAWAADQGATIGNLSANSNYDTTFRNKLVNLGNGVYKSTDTRYNYGSGQYYNMQDPAEWKAVTDRGMVVVNSAGNQGLSVSANPGYFATLTDNSGNLLLGGRMLIVGAADENNNLYSWSNKAGHICQNYVAATNTCSDTYKVSDFYIMAPGGTISTSINGSTGYKEGTSMAAPVVTGGLAIISQMWPYMKGENLVRLLTTTANKNIPNYDAGVHGSGMMDLDKATQPVGAVGIPTSGRTTSSVSTASISNTGGSGSALSAIKNTGSLSQVMIVDEFARDFYVNLAQGIRVKDKRKVSEVGVQQAGTSYLPFQQSLGVFDQGGEWSITDDLKFGFANTKDVKGDYTSHVTKGWSIDKNIKLRTTLGTVGERNSWLGNDSSGALAVGKNNKTYFSQIGFDYVEATDKWSIDLGRGYTSVNTTENSLIKSVDNLQSQSVKLGFERSINENQKWGITVGMPNYISKGSANISVPYATTLDGDVVYDNVKANLKTRTPERNLGFYYTQNGETDLDWNVRFNTEFRNNLAGESGKNGVGFGITVEKRFWGSCGIGPWLNMKEFCVKMREDEEKFKKEYAKKSQIYEDMLSGKNSEAIGWNK
jgi:subtilisin family serine protease